MTFRAYGLPTILLLIALHTPAFAAGWSAGVSKVNITPPKFIWMSGYGGRNHPAEGKLTDLWAKTLVLKDSRGKQGVVITLDLVGVDRDFSQKVCAAIVAKHGVKRADIAICTSHTHTGPVVGGNLKPLHYLTIDASQQKLVDEYTVWLSEQIAVGVKEAFESIAPAEIAWGSGEATFAVNRRNNREPDVPKLRADNQLKGPFDHDVPVLAVRSGKKLRAVLFGYACHATVLSFYQWSGDYPGFAQIEVEKAHPGCVALFWAGCGADQNPLPRRKVELAQQYGGRLAKAVDRVLAGDMAAVAAELKTGYVEIPLALDKLPTREQIEKDSESTNKWVKARAEMFLEQIDAGAPLAQTYPYPIGVWKVGADVKFVTLGGEVVVDFAVRTKRELGGVKTWVAGYSHDVMAYIPSRRVLLEGGYEGAGAMVYYGLPTKWAITVEDDIMKAIHRLSK